MPDEVKQAKSAYDLGSKFGLFGGGGAEGAAGFVGPKMPFGSGMAGIGIGLGATFGIPMLMQSLESKPMPHISIAKRALTYDDPIGVLLAGAEGEMGDWWDGMAKGVAEIKGMQSKFGGGVADVDLTAAERAQKRQRPGKMFQMGLREILTKAPPEYIQNYIQSSPNGAKLETAINGMYKQMYKTSKRRYTDAEDDYTQSVKRGEVTPFPSFDKWKTLPVGQYKSGNAVSIEKFLTGDRNV